MCLGNMISCVTGGVVLGKVVEYLDRIMLLMMSVAPVWMAGFAPVLACSLVSLMQRI